MTYIKDTLLEPYFIEVMDNCLVLHENTGKIKFDKVKQVDKEVTAVVGHYSNLFSALNKVSKLKTMEKQDAFTLKEYITTYENTVKELLDKIKI